MERVIQQRPDPTASRPAGGAGDGPPAGPVPLQDGTPSQDAVRLQDEEGSLITEYFLLAIVAATIASLALKWAAGGAIWQLFAAVFGKVRILVGA